MPPKIEASLEDAQATILIPDKTWQHLVIAGKPSVVRTKGNPTTGSRAGNPMVTLTLEVADGPFKGARIFGHNVMLGGVTATDQPMPLRNLIELLDTMAADGVPWQCMKCGQEGDRRFRRGGEKGTREYAYFVCPDCGERARFSFDTDNWEGHRLNGLCKQGTFIGSDEPRNELGRIRPYGELPQDGADDSN